MVGRVPLPAWLSQLSLLGVTYRWCCFISVRCHPPPKLSYRFRLANRGRALVVVGSYNQGPCGRGLFHLCEPFCLSCSLLPRILIGQRLVTPGKKDFSNYSVHNWKDLWWISNKHLSEAVPVLEFFLTFPGSRGTQKENHRHITNTGCRQFARHYIPARLSLPLPIRNCLKCVRKCKYNVRKITWW